jgi:hypothetical protein
MLPVLTSDCSACGCENCKLKQVEGQLCFYSVAMFQVTKRLKEKEIKRQEHIYEFVLTEKHHCLTLRVMQKV